MRRPRSDGGPNIIKTVDPLSKLCSALVASFNLFDLIFFYYYFAGAYVDGRVFCVASLDTSLYSTRFHFNWKRRQQKKIKNGIGRRPTRYSFFCRRKIRFIYRIGGKIERELLASVSNMLYFLPIVFFFFFFFFFRICLSPAFLLLFFLPMIRFLSFFPPLFSRIFQERRKKMLYLFVTIRQLGKSESIFSWSNSFSIQNPIPCTGFDGYNHRPHWVAKQSFLFLLPLFCVIIVIILFHPSLSFSLNIMSSVWIPHSISLVSFDYSISRVYIHMGVVSEMMKFPNRSARMLSLSFHVCIAFQKADGQPMEVEEEERI